MENFTLECKKATTFDVSVLGRIDAFFEDYSCVEEERGYR